MSALGREHGALFADRPSQGDEELLPDTVDFLLMTMPCRRRVTAMLPVSNRVP
jgi:hypothetical protein